MHIRYQRLSAVFYLLLIGGIAFSLYQFAATYRTSTERRLANEIPYFDDTLHIILSENHPRLLPYEVEYDDDVFLINQLYQGLVKFDKNMVESPDLATYWRINQERNEYTFYLDEKATFHNGQPVTARDVVASLSYFLKHFPHNYLLPYFYVVQGVEEFVAGKSDSISGIRVSSDSEVRFKLNHPYVPFLKLLTLPETKILPAALLKGNVAELRRHPVGSGPYFLSQLRDSSLVLEAYRFRETAGNPPFVRYFKIYLGSSQAFERFYDANFDLTYFFDDSLAKSGFEVQQVKTLAQTFLGLNCAKFPTSDIDFRRAIHWTVDKDSIVRLYEYAGVAVERFSPISLPLDTLWEKKRNVDIAKASSFLAKFKSKYKLVHIPEITFLVDTLDFYFDAYRIISRNLEKIGIPVRFIYYKANELDLVTEKRLMEQNHLFLWGWLMDLPEAEFYFEPFFSSKSYLNIFQYRNKTVDSLLERANSLPYLSDRLHLFARIEQILEKENPLIPLFNNVDFLMYRNDLQNITLNRLGYANLDLSRIWVNRPAAIKQEVALK